MCLHRAYTRPARDDLRSTSIRYRELFGSLFRRDLRAKYKGSVLGLAWSLAHPVVLMLVYLFVFSVLLKIQTGRLRALLALPARRPAGLGLLRDLAAVGRREACSRTRT